MLQLVWTRLQRTALLAATGLVEANPHRWGSNHAASSEANLDAKPERLASGRIAGKALTTAAVLLDLRGKKTTINLSVA